MASRELKKKKLEDILHVVAIPFPLQGHMNPMLALARKLAMAGATVTLVTTDRCHASIAGANRGPPGKGRIRNLRLVHVSDGLPLDFDRTVQHEEFLEALRSAMVVHVEALVAGLRWAQPPVSCIVADTAFAWVDSVAKKFDLFHVSFWTESAAAFSIYRHWNLLHGEGRIWRSAENNHSTIEGIPGISALPKSEVPTYLENSEEKPTFIQNLIREAMTSAEGADLILSSAIRELERETVDAIAIQSPFLCIGPLLLLPENGTKTGEKSNLTSLNISMWPERDCRNWLKNKPRGSVLYVSFGSYASIAKDQIREMAMGLLQSKQSFIWVLRPGMIYTETDDPHKKNAENNDFDNGDSENPNDSNSDGGDFFDVLPAGFEQSCRGRGIVVGWCRQIEILGDEAVGGFLTHCGWNSVVESLWHGVPMLAFPLMSDQFTNQGLIVRQWRVAVPLGGSRGGRDVVLRDEISASVRTFMENQRFGLQGNGATIREDLHRAGIESSERIVQALVRMREKRDHLLHATGSVISV